MDHSSTSRNHNYREKLVHSDYPREVKRVALGLTQESGANWIMLEFLMDRTQCGHEFNKVCLYFKCS